MGLPITKTITLAWDGVNWRDQETGVLVEGVQRLYEHIQVQNGGVRLHDGRIIADEPEQENAHPHTPKRVISAGGWYDAETDVSVKNLTASDAEERHHPFGKSFAVTYEQVQKMIADALYQRAAKTHMYFEQGPEQIVTVAYHRETIDILCHEIKQLERRIGNLERPWWKRW